MKERGMIFNAEMVRAILEGRKTQTRRPVKPQPELTERSGFSWNGVVFGSGSDDRETNRNFAHVKCPFGKPGDRIWVRETFQGPLFDYEQMQSYLEDSSKFEKPEFCQYAADGKPAPEYYDADDNLHCGWCPSIHMPRWASRITLEIIDVRVERLHSISERDALREGLFQLPASGRYCLQPGMQYFGMASHSAKEVYSWLWASIYGEESWAANPWVWVIEFKRVEGGAA
ncbi:morphogenetic protein [Salmonella enterica subsp. enterica serovar Legon]|nr:morphogenetic protein [Salmonella enterica subsp. enterica serovar Legon]